MMQAIKQSRSDKLIWKCIGGTSSRNAAWAFDRFRLYYPTERTKVAVLMESEVSNTAIIPEVDYRDGHSYLAPHFVTNLDNKNLVAGPPQRFSSTNNFEHDFTFNLSGVTDTFCWIYIQGVPYDSLFQQLYAYPTGYGATRNKNAELEFILFRQMNFGETGGARASILLNGQPIGDGLGGGTDADATDTFIINAATLNVSNCLFNSAHLSNIMNGLDNSGILNGHLDYTGNTAVPYTQVYNNLANKGWTLVGPAPSQ